MEKKEKDVRRCCFCGKPLVGDDRFGNNPEPLMDHGRCCNACNADLVIPARIAALHALRAKEKNNTD